MDNTMRKVALKELKLIAEVSEVTVTKRILLVRPRATTKTIRGRTAHRDAEAGLRRCPGRSILTRETPYLSCSTQAGRFLHHWRLEPRDGGRNLVNILFQSGEHTARGDDTDYSMVLQD